MSADLILTLLTDPASAAAAQPLPRDPLAAFERMCRRSIEAWEASGAVRLLVAETRDPDCAGALLWFDSPQQLADTLARLAAGESLHASYEVGGSAPSDPRWGCAPNPLSIGSPRRLSRRLT